VRLALDTNILAHAEGVNGAPIRKAALELVQKLPEGTTLLPLQTLAIRRLNRMNWKKESCGPRFANS
jgi:predicted nucleic acid-binding protein